MSHNKNLPIFYNNNAFLDLNNLYSFYTFKLVYNYFNILKDLYINFFSCYFGYTINNFNLFFFFNNVDIYIDFIIFFYNICNSLFFKYYNINNIQLKRLLNFSSIFKNNFFLNKNSDYLLYYIYYFYKIKGFNVKRLNLKNSLMFFNKLNLKKKMTFIKKNIFEILIVFFNYFFYCIFFIIIYFNFQNFKQFNVINIFIKFLIHFLKKKNKILMTKYNTLDENMNMLDLGKKGIKNNFYFFLILLLNFISLRFLLKKNEIYVFFIFFYNFIFKYKSLLDFNSMNKKFFFPFMLLIEVLFKNVFLFQCPINYKLNFKYGFLMNFNNLNKFFKKINITLYFNKIMKFFICGELKNKFGFNYRYILNFFYKINYINFYFNFLKMAKLKKITQKIILIIFFNFINFSLFFEFFFENLSDMSLNIFSRYLNVMKFNKLLYFKNLYLYISSNMLKNNKFFENITKELAYKCNNVFRYINNWRSIYMFSRVFRKGCFLPRNFFKLTFVNNFNKILINIKKKIYLFFFYIFQIETTFKRVFQKNNLLFKVFICFYIRYFKFFRFFIYLFFNINHNIFFKNKFQIKNVNISLFYKFNINKFFFYKKNIRNVTNMIFFDNTILFLKYISCFNLVNHFLLKHFNKITYSQKLIFNQFYLSTIVINNVKKIQYNIKYKNNIFFFLKKKFNYIILYYKRAINFNFLFYFLKKKKNILQINLFKLIIKVLNIFVNIIKYKTINLDIFYQNYINSVIIHNMNMRFNLSQFFFYNFDFSIFFFKNFLLYFNKLYLKYICFVFCNCLFCLNNFLCLYFNFNFFGFFFFCEFINYIFKLNKSFKFIYFKQNLINFRFVGLCGLYLLLFKFITMITFIFSDILMDYIFLLFSFYFFKNKYGKIRTSLKLLRIIFNEFLFNYSHNVKGFHFQIKGRLSKRTQRKRRFAVNVGILNWSPNSINYLYHKQKTLKTHIGSVSIKFTINFVNKFDNFFENMLYK